MGMGPFDLTGGAFLALYGSLLVLAVAASLMLHRALRPEGRPGRIDGLDELALLSGGPVRLAEATTARLLADGSLKQQGRRQFQAVNRSGGQTAVERAILQKAQPADWADILRVVGNERDAITRRLAAKGLMLDRSERMRLGLIAATPLLLTLGFGAVKLFIGISRDKPVGFLLLLLFVTAFFVLIRLGTVTTTTHEGQRLVERERKRFDRARRAPMQDEMGTSVALFGTAVLAGSALSDFETMRRRDSGSDGGSADSGGDGGCGGGGCGGCGS